MVCVPAVDNCLDLPALLKTIITGYSRRQVTGNGNLA